MSPPKYEFQRSVEQGEFARLEFIRTGDLKALHRMITKYGEAHNMLPERPSQTTPQNPPPGLKTTPGQNPDKAARYLNQLRLELEAAGDNPPPGLLTKIQIATQAYQAWMTALKSAADSKGQVQGELARFR